MDQPHADMRPFEFLILALSIYALAALAFESMVVLEPSTVKLLIWADTGVCVVFLIDFGYRFARAENRWHYMATWGWLDLISSIPTIPFFGLGRIARTFRVLRLLRGVRAIKVIAGSILERRAEGAFLAVCLVSLLITLSAAIGILRVETAPTSNIKGPVDALWWAIATITTVGSSDRYPVTAAGRAIGALLMISGVGFFGTLSGFIASWFLAPAQRRYEADLQGVRGEIQSVSRTLEARETHSVASVRG
jgi:voltage-gated potassium channel